MAVGYAYVLAEAEMDEPGSALCEPPHAVRVSTGASARSTARIPLPLTTGSTSSPTPAPLLRFRACRTQRGLPDQPSPVPKRSPMRARYGIPARSTTPTAL